MNKVINYSHFIDLYQDEGRDKDSRNANSNTCNTDQTSDSQSAEPGGLTICNNDDITG